MSTKVPKLVIKNARIIFRNFSGEVSQYNKNGDRSFCVVLEDPDYAQELREAGWNVRIKAPKEDGDDTLMYLPVKVRYTNFPPRIYTVVGRRKTLLDERAVSSLDYADIDDIDLVIRPYNWEVKGEHGVSAYVDEMYVSVTPSAFGDKYEFED